MAVEKTKHEFVDDNPYLVYSGEPDATADNAGGGDDSPFLYVDVKEDILTWTQNQINLTLSESPETVVDAMRTGKMVIFILHHSSSGSLIYVRAEYLYREIFVLGYYRGTGITSSSEYEYHIRVGDGGANGIRMEYQPQS